MSLNFRLQRSSSPYSLTQHHRSFLDTRLKDLSSSQLTKKTHHRTSLDGSCVATTDACALSGRRGQAATTCPRGPYGKRRNQKPVYSYRELCRLHKVWDAPQRPSGDPSIPEKSGTSETMTGVSDLLKAINRHTWAHEDRENQRLRQSSVTPAHSSYHLPIGIECDVASRPQAGARPSTVSRIGPICEYSM